MNVRNSALLSWPPSAGQTPLTSLSATFTSSCPTERPRGNTRYGPTTWRRQGWPLTSLCAQGHPSLLQCICNASAERLLRARRGRIPSRALGERTAAAPLGISTLQRRPTHLPRPAVCADRSGLCGCPHGPRISDFGESRPRTVGGVVGLDGMLPEWNEGVPHAGLNGPSPIDRWSDYDGNGMAASACTYVIRT